MAHNLDVFLGEAIYAAKLYLPDCIIIPVISQTLLN